MSNLVIMKMGEIAEIIKDLMMNDDRFDECFYTHNLICVLDYYKDSIIKKER